MNQKLDLRKMEKKAWNTYYAQDGLYDILFGIMMVVGAIRTITDIPWVTLGILAGILVIPLGKRYITTPRIGRVKFGEERMGKMTVVIAGIGIGVGITSLIFFLTVYSGDFPKILGSFLMVVMIVGVFSLMAYFLDHFRLFFYGIFFASTEFIWFFFGRNTAAYYELFLGTIILFVGIFFLIRFLKMYPIPGEEVTNGL